MFHWSWLLWPNSNVWPRDGEIDFPEMDSNSGSTSAFMHWLNATSGSTADAYNMKVPAYGAWHTAVIEWLPTRCSFYLDGNLVGSSTNTSHIPNTPMHYVIQFNGAGSTPDNATQGHVYIDWVAIYKRV
jgi:beta-glucanase (GH16 family)